MSVFGLLRGIQRLGELLDRLHGTVHRQRVTGRPDSADEGRDVGQRALQHERFRAVPLGDVGVDVRDDEVLVAQFGHALFDAAALA